MLPDLVRALAQNMAAEGFFAQLNKTEKYAIILRLVKERTAIGRAARLNKMIATMAAGRIKIAGSQGT